LRSNWWTQLPSAIREAKPDELKEEKERIAAAQRDPEQFAWLYEKYYRSIFLFVYRRVQDTAIAGDVTSQVFLRAMLNLNKYKYKGKPFGAWLFRIALNEVNQFFRSTKREKTVPISEKDLVSILEAGEMSDETVNLEKMVQALNTLPHEQAEIIELRFFEGYSFQSIAAILGTNVPTAKMRVYRILKKLKTQILQKGSWIGIAS